MRLTSLLTRAAVVGGLALAGAGVSALPSSAASEDIEYQCEWAVGETDGEGDLGVASWDTAIADDGSLVVEVGARVPLDPYTGSITLPEAFVSALRAAERTELDVDGVQLTVVDETGEPYVMELDVEPTPIPASGPMVVAVEGVDPEDIEAFEPGTVTLLAVAFFIADGDIDSEEQPQTFLLCEVEDEQTAVVDTFTVAEDEDPVPTVTATVVPTPTVTVTMAPASPSPVRPVLVQTDAPETSGPSTGALALAGLGAGALVLAGRRLVRRPARRH